MFLRCLFHCGFHRLSTVTLFGASYFRHYLFLIILKLQTIPNKRRQTRPKKPSTKKPYKRTLSREERNTKNTFIEGLVKRVLNNKSASNNNKMAYAYYTKILKEYGSALLS